MAFRNNNILLASLCFIFTSSFGNIISASAQNQPNCIRPTTTIEYNTCARLAYESADRELNVVWRQVISRLGSDEKEQLINRQLAWVEERDAACDRETIDNRGGSGYRYFLNNCLRRVTVERTAFLRGYLR